MLRVKIQEKIKGFTPLEKNRFKRLKLRLSTERSLTGFTRTPKDINVTSRREVGFTLIEMLVYIAIVTVISVLVVGVLVSLSKSYAQLKITQSINESATSALNRMLLEIRQAYDVDTVASTFNVHPGQLTLDTMDTLGNNTEVSFLVSAGQIRVLENGVDAGVLTRSDVQLTSLIFEHLVSGESEAIRIWMVIEGSIGKVTKEEVFSTAAVLRGSY